MSSRALRKAQRAREKIDLGREQAEYAEESDDGDAAPRAAARPSPFAMLSEVQEDANDEGDEEPESVTPSEDDPAKLGDGVTSTRNNLEDFSGKTENQSKQKKKKKKKKGANASTADARTVATHSNLSKELDEIDLAVQHLSANPQSGSIAKERSNESTPEDEISRLLSIDTHHLQVSNEMRRLFGRAAFEADDEERTARRTRNANEGNATLADAVSGKLSKKGAGLPAVLRRRNIFVNGKEEWPRDTSNGLTMKILSKDGDREVEYEFVWNFNYVMQQMGFTECQAMMDPAEMVNLLRYYPYNVSALLQVSEIAKQEKDYATSGELIERALFTFGKALHPTFAANMAKGRARLDFGGRQSREFFLAAWKYIENIGMRATWRTAYEWARLLLSLSPDDDEYCVRLFIDQLAIRARQHQSFSELAQSNFFSEKWKDLPNIHYSQSLAQHMMGDEASTGESMLKEAIKRWPWVAARIFQELGIEKIPPSIWGQTAISESQVLHCELYVTLALDLWKLPEASKFLQSTAAKIPLEDITPYFTTAEITLDEARYVVLLEKPALIGLLPRKFTSRLTTMLDPLHPESEGGPTALRVLDRPSRAAAQRPVLYVQQDPGRFIRELDVLQRSLGHIIPALANVYRSSSEELDLSISWADFEPALQRPEIANTGVGERLRDLWNMLELLRAQAGGRLEGEIGEEAVIIPGGPARITLPSSNDSDLEFSSWETEEGDDGEDENEEVVWEE